jgi:pyruvate dehydrogenase E2 component (dihydrolipoamide acetyltransferase)
MPRLSDSMEEGTIVRWLKASGDEVQRGEDLVEIETDKATMTYQADAGGVLEILAQEGATLAIGEAIGRIGDAPSAPPDGNGSEPVVAEVPAPTAAATPPAAPHGATALREAPEPGGRVKASPVARRLARELGIELGAVDGSGPGGRVVKADVQAAAESTPAAAQAPAEPTPASPADPAPVTATAKGEARTIEPTRAQGVIARRMAEAKATIPEFTLTAEVDMERAAKERAELKAVSRGGEIPSYNDMVVKAVALALREFPRANGSYRDGRFELHARVNVGVAVATADALVVPVVFDADGKTLGEIARGTRTLSERARDGSITPPELSGATFTVSNLGMYGIDSFTAVINPPQAAILAVGSVAQRAVAREGQVVARHTMSLTLACDHRILYGAPAAEFLARVRDLLENPASLAL